MDLSRKSARDRLPRRKAPYWQGLGTGKRLGFRRGAKSDTWLAWFRKKGGSEQQHFLGEGLDFDAAKDKAEEWFAQLENTAARVVKRASVRAALEKYLEDLRRHGRGAAADAADWRFRKYVWDDPLAGIELESATRDDFLEWRDRHREGRAARTVERQFRSVRAGLNRALELGHVGNPAAWKLKALQDDVDDSGETAIFLTPAQREALIAAAETPIAVFLRGMELTGARPIELANAKVSDFDGQTLRLAHRKGKPPKLRVRHVVLGSEGIAFFKKHAHERLSTSYIFTEDGEQQWRRHMWARKVRAAITAHDKLAAQREPPQEPIPVGASAYSFRHARISELLQIHGVDPLTVAAQTGTSLAMIEKAYLRFIPHAMREKLAGINGMAG
jgi:integrase